VDGGDILANDSRFAEKRGKIVVRTVAHKQINDRTTHPSTAVGNFFAEERRPFTLMLVDMLYDENV
jgi:hypothetical protein